MRLPRRTILRLAAGAVALPASSRFALAQAYPAKPVRFVVGFAAGGSNDILARLFGERLSERLGQPFIVENRVGASGNIAAEAVAKAAPDGYTLLFVNAPNAINATLYDNLNFDFGRDIAPIGSIAHTPFVMVVNPSVPATTVAEFVAYAKANPGKLNMASTGSGTPGHILGEMFKSMAGVNMLHIPYRASPFPDLLAGQVHVYFSPIPVAIGYIRAGTLRALGVTSAARLNMLPDVPAVTEFVPGYEATGWYGIVAPRNTPASIIDKLSAETNSILANPAVRARFADLGAIAFPSSPAEFGKFIADEIEKWATVIRTSNIKPE